MDHAPLRQMADYELAYKRVLIREDLNVPMEGQRILHDARLRAAVPTIRYAQQQGAAVMVLSHLGRPAEGVFDPQYSLRPVATALADLLGEPVRFAPDLAAAQSIQPGQVVLLENVRFLRGETTADETLSRTLAQWCEIFVMDAFACSHRTHASTYGVARYAPIRVAGPLLCQEIGALSRIFANPQAPVVAIVGGSKVSTKFQVLAALLKTVDVLIPGGGIANTFLAAQGYAMGGSMYEPDWIDAAREMMRTAQERGVQIWVPRDVRVGLSLTGPVHRVIRWTDPGCEPDEKILDIGPETEQAYAACIQSAKTILWNGPVGVFENPAFGSGTQTIGQAIASSRAFSVAGGGDTLSALHTYGLMDKIGYVSTGGGAFLEFLEGKPFPCIDLLRTEMP